MIESDFLVPLASKYIEISMDTLCVEALENVNKKNFVEQFPIDLV